MWFEIIGQVQNVEVIAEGRGIRDIKRLNKFYGNGKWRKLKGTAEVKLPNNKICEAEIHWYEAHGIGKREYKIKKIL